MKLRTYSSLTAFIAHYAALCAARSDGAAPSPDAAATLIEMERIIEDLSEADRAALSDAARVGGALRYPDGAAERHRARADLKLHRLLTARGVLAG